MSESQNHGIDPQDHAREPQKYDVHLQGPERVLEDIGSRPQDPGRAPLTPVDAPPMPARVPLDPVTKSVNHAHDPRSTETSELQSVNESPEKERLPQRGAVLDHARARRAGLC